MINYYPVELEDGTYTYRNAETGELCEQRFKETRDLSVRDCCTGVVLTDDGWTYFIPESGTLFQARFYSREFITLESAVRQFPEDFDKLPTEYFKYGSTVKKFLNAVAEGVKDLCHEKGSSEELEEYTKGIYQLVSEKIEREKEKIESEKKDSASKQEIAEKFADDIQDLGRKF